MPFLPFWLAKIQISAHTVVKETEQGLSDIAGGSANWYNQSYILGLTSSISRNLSWRDTWTNATNPEAKGEAERRVID